MGRSTRWSPRPLSCQGSPQPKFRKLVKDQNRIIPSPHLSVELAWLQEVNRSTWQEWFWGEWGVINSLRRRITKILMGQRHKPPARVHPHQGHGGRCSPQLPPHLRSACMCLCLLRCRIQDSESALVHRKLRAQVCWRYPTAPGAATSQKQYSVWPTDRFHSFALHKSSDQLTPSTVPLCMIALWKVPRLRGLNIW